VTAAWHAGQASLGVPSVDINYGAAPNVQLHAQPRFAVERDSGTERGIDDTEIGIKYRFCERKDGDDSFMLAIYPIYLLPTGAKRLGTDRGTRGMFLPLWAQYDRGPWTIYGGGGYRVNPAANGRNSTFSGLTMLRKVTDILQLGIEAFHETPTTRDVRSTSGFNIGGARVLSPRLNLLFSAGRGFGEGTSSLAYIGIQTHF